MEREFDVQRDHVRLLELVAQLLEPGGQIVFSNNFQKFKLDPTVMQAFEVEDLSRATLPADFARNPRIHACFLLKPRLAGCAGPGGSATSDAVPPRRQS
jgi:23S rRNA (guanine2445-N2)-methyltransferase / 23S rRNA (guanine2069-N7)-methyltransferase